MARKKKTVAEKPAIEEIIIPTDITSVMENSYRDYAAAVVTGRAIPDVRDGLKPVHRRILYAMLNGYDWTQPYRKSARIVGDVMGKYHPHGDSSIYEALARLSQPWSLSTPLIDGQGNFGSMDGDKPAAMRYTEARLSIAAKYLAGDIKKDTVDFQPNYDEQETEPTVLPAAFPNILVNGGSGIAVGMASSIPTHNFKEVVQATRWRIKHPDGELEDVMNTIIGGPDFPTKGKIMGQDGIKKAYETGRGKLDLESNWDFDKIAGTPTLVYHDMPWGVSKEAVLKRISDLMNEGKLPEVTGARDESDRTGTRFVVELKKDADAEKVDARLKTLTDLRIAVPINFTALDGTSVPREMGLLEILDRWIAFREVTLRRRTIFELRKARDKARLLFGRILALSMIDKIIALIKKSGSPALAIEALMTLKFKRADFEDLVVLLGTEEQKKGKTFTLTKTQAEDILAIRLARLTGLERDALAQEAKACAEEVRTLSGLLNTPGALRTLMDTELEELENSKMAIDRQSVISDETAKVARGGATAAEVLLPKTPLFVHLYQDGSIGRSAKQATSETPGVLVEEAHTHARYVFFSNKGTAYGLSVMDMPDLDERKGEARLLPGLLGFSPDGDIIGHTMIDADREDATLVFVSADSYVRRTSMSEFSSIPTPGKLAMKIADNDAPLLQVLEQHPGEEDILLATKNGKVLRFALDGVRVFAGRSSRGVRGMKLDTDDTIASAVLLPQGPDTVAADEAEAAWKNGKHDGPLLVQLCASGHAKRTPANAYRTMGRGGKGINDKGPAKTIGDVVAFLKTQSDDNLFWPEEQWLNVNDIKRAGKAATGGKPFEEITAIPLVIPTPNA